MFFRNSLIFILFFLVCIFSVSAEWVGKVIISTSQENEQTLSRERVISQLLKSIPFSPFVQQPLSIYIDHTLIEPRGRMKWKKITLSSWVVKESEFIKLFIHEFGHVVDIYFLTPNNQWLDVSENFYRISWQNSTLKKAWQKQTYFVSGYAATNQYEDFAESFTFYIFHNRTFEERALRDEIMRQKYLFFRQNVFPHGSFVDTDFSLGKVPSYFWDTTKLPISLQKYLYSLN